MPPANAAAGELPRSPGRSTNTGGPVRRDVHPRRLAEASHRPDAPEAAQEAVDLDRELVDRNRDVDLPDLAKSMNNLTDRLAETVRCLEAFEAAQEAANYYRVLDDRHPGIFQSSRAENRDSLEQVWRLGIGADRG